MTLALPLALVLLAAPPAEPTAAADPWAVGDSPVAPAGSQAAPLQPGGAGAWRGAVATGIAYRAGGEPLASTHEDHGVLLYFGGQADGVWTEGLGHTVRLRGRVFTGGESSIYLPSEGDLEGAWSIGRRELRFVVARVEAARYPSLAVDALVQAGTLPCFEGAVGLDADRVRLDWFLSPVEAAWVRYRGAARVPSAPGWPSEADSVSAATAARIRVSGVFVPSVIVSAQGDLLKMWRKADLLLSAEGSIGWEVLRRSAELGLVLRLDDYTRRGVEPDTTASDWAVTLLATVTLAF
jgi:hypothetical protein